MSTRPMRAIRWTPGPAGEPGRVAFILRARRTGPRIADAVNLGDVSVHGDTPSVTMTLKRCPASLRLAVLLGSTMSLLAKR